MPAGQIALLTPGACCKAVTSAFPAITVASSIPKATADISGTERNAKPALKAVKMSPRMKLEVLSGSTRVINDGIMSAARELAKFRARYQFVKNLFIAISKKSVCQSCAD